MLPPRDSTEKLTAGTRLESWKEIAAYLNRDVRTVQRWEKVERLPVHRHVHETLATVYAYTTELDVWQTDRTKRASVETDTPLKTHQAWFRPLWGIGLVIALALVTPGSHRSGPALHFKERDWVMLDGFENRTGEALFEGTLRAALERELSNSEFISVAPRERVEDALRLMKQPPDTMLTAAQAREVCLRDGDIRALVTGRTERVGSTYLVSAEVIDPVQNRTLASDTETASGQDQIWPAVRRLSNWVRETLGETMERIDRSNRQLEKVTTPSLRALQLFTEADTASKRGEWAVSAQITRQALAEDPEFASARIWLAYALKNFKDPEWKAEAQRALDLSGKVSERERYFIVGSYEQLMGRIDRAIPPFEALVRRYPDHYFAYRNLLGIYSRMGRFEEKASLAAKFADARPKDPDANAAALSLNDFTDHLERARHYAQRAAELGSLESLPLSDQVEIIFFHAHDLWMQDDAKSALAELDHLAARRKDWPDPRLQVRVTTALASYYLTLGKFQSSQALIQSLDGEERPGWSALASFFEGDEEHARQNAALMPPSQNHWLLWGFLLARLSPPGAETKLLGQENPWVRGEVALTQGRFAEAATLLQGVFDKNCVGRHYWTHWIVDGLVTALEQSGNSQKALEVLETTSRTRGWITTTAEPQGDFWLRNQARLSAYYHRLGRQQDARKIDDQLRKLLAVADPDHPILRQLNVQQARVF